jgi:D-tyrosyl-tRNA(Tyr) deacylase
MRVIIQRCSRAEVNISQKTVGKIGRGFVLLVGFTHTDSEKDIAWCAKKVAGMRIFEDEEGKMNRSLKEANGAILSISQFTLYANAKKGNRPSFIEAARPELAEPLYQRFNEILRDEYHLTVATGQFGADMKVDFVNDGPVTIILVSTEM